MTQQEVHRKMYPLKTRRTWPKLSSILAEMARPLHYRRWQATCRLPRVFKLNLTNFQAVLNKQSRVLIVHVPFSLSERHGLPLSHKLQCCGGTVMSSRIVKMTHVACLAETQLPGLCLCQSLLMRKRLVGMLQNCWVYNDWHGLFLFPQPCTIWKCVNNWRETSKKGSCRTELIQFTAIFSLMIWLHGFLSLIELYHWHSDTVLILYYW